MKLYIMRHGPAEDFADSGRDFDRALTDAGRERVRFVARALRDAGELPRAVLSSPLVRARQTAAIVAPLAIDAQDVTLEEALSPGGASGALVRSLCAAGRRRVMIVGHEPDLGELVSELLDAPFGRDMLKAMVVELSLRAPDAPATLRFVLDPKSLELSRA
jgi:phosphohistidine phosphatase